MSPLADKIIRTNFTKQQALAALLELRIAAKKSDPTFFQAEKELEKMPELVIFTAVELPDTEVVKVGEKARSLFDPDLLLDFKVDSALIGGAALAWKGQYKDYSIRARLAEKKAEIQKIYEQY